MTDRHSGYIVVLKHDIREDDAAATVAALEQIKGVIKVTPVVADVELMLATQRARFQCSEQVLDLVREWNK